MTDMTRVATIVKTYNEPGPYQIDKVEKHRIGWIVRERRYTTVTYNIYRVRDRNGYVDKIFTRLKDARAWIIEEG
jgi:hypothetical protein